MASPTRRIDKTLAFTERYGMGNKKLSKVLTAQQQNNFKAIDYTDLELKIMAHFEKGNDK